MKTTVKNLVIRFFAYLMIGIIGMLVVNKIVFLHVHKLSDGTIIEHAHPFDKSADSKPFKSHQHSNAQLVFLDNLNILFFVLSLILSLLLFVKREQKIKDAKIRYSSTSISHKKSRAPPTLLYQYYNIIS